MPEWLLFVLGVLVLMVVFLAWRLASSGTLRHLQLRRAARMASSGDTEGMVRFLRRNMRRSSVSDPLTNALVYFLIRAGRLEEAGEVVREAMERGDDSGMALAQLGYVKGGGGDREGAEELYRKAMEKDPSLAPTMRVNIAGMLIESGERLEEAEELLESALEEREGVSRAGVHINLAMLHLKRDRPVEARVQALIAYDLVPPGNALLAPTRANALALAARACSHAGDTDEAARLADKALKVIEGSPAAAGLAEELDHLKKAGR